MSLDGPLESVSIGWYQNQIWAGNREGMVFCGAGPGWLSVPVWMGAVCVRFTGAVGWTWGLVGCNV